MNAIARLEPPITPRPDQRDAAYDVAVLHAPRPWRQTPSSSKHLVGGASRC